MNLTHLTPCERAVVEWQYRRVGDFRKALWDAICAADDGNLELLSLGFPVEVAGYKLYTRSPGWWQEVQDKAQTASAQIAGCK